MGAAGYHAPIVPMACAYVSRESVDGIIITAARKRNA